MTESMDTIGLIAGNGRFPFLFARAAKDQNIRVVAAGIKGDTTWHLKFFVSKLRWFRVGQLTAVFQYFLSCGVRHVIMAGQVHPKNLFDDNIRLDGEFKDLFQAVKDRKADTIFSAIAEKLHQHGLELLDSTFLLKKYLAPQGTLTHRGPTLLELDDIVFGKHIAKSMGGLDIGQTVVIKDKAIVAIEAMEGTDRCVVRGGGIAQQGAVVVKMSKPEQDFRFDVPVVGPRTIRHMTRVRAGCLAIEAGKTIIIDPLKTISLANKASICIIATP